MAPVTWIVVAFVVAVLVLVIAGSVGSGGQGARQFFGDLRAGLSGGSGAERHRIGLLSETRRELHESAEATGGSVDDIFRLGEAPDHAYVETAEFAEPLTRVGHRVREVAARVRH
jgi:hypothetical protein